MTAAGNPDEPIPEVVRSEHLARRRYLDFGVDTVRYPDGREGQYVVVGHPGAVALVVLDAAGRWLLVRQYRHAARRWLLEIPAGTREEGEAPELTAAREVREETGYAAGRLERLGGTYMVPGWGAEYIDYYLATDLTLDPLPQDADEGIAEPIPMTIDEVYRAVEDGRIADAKTIVALMLFERRRGR